MCENLKTYGFIDENLVIVYSDQWKRNLDDGAYFWSWFSNVDVATA